MSNGDGVSIDLSNVSLTLLNEASKTGRLPMLNLSDFARRIMATGRMGGRTTVPIKSYLEVFPYQSRLSRLDERQELKLAEIYSSFSIEDMVRMDSQGIPILNTFIEYDFTGRDWADQEASTDKLWEIEELSGLAEIEWVAVGIDLGRENSIRLRLTLLVSGEYKVSLGDEIVYEGDSFLSAVEVCNEQIRKAMD